MELVVIVDSIMCQSSVSVVSHVSARIRVVVGSGGSGGAPPLAFLGRMTVVILGRLGDAAAFRPVGIFLFLKSESVAVVF